jgi:hypothetical protein
MSGTLIHILIAGVAYFALSRIPGIGKLITVAAGVGLVYAAAQQYMSLREDATGQALAEAFALYLAYGLVRILVKRWDGSDVLYVRVLAISSAFAIVLYVTHLLPHASDGAKSLLYLFLLAKIVLCCRPRPHPDDESSDSDEEESVDSDKGVIEEYFSRKVAATSLTKADLITFDMQAKHGVWIGDEGPEAKAFSDIVASGIQSKKVLILELKRIERIMQEKHPVAVGKTWQDVVGSLWGGLDFSTGKKRAYEQRPQKSGVATRTLEPVGQSDATQKVGGEGGQHAIEDTESDAALEEELGESQSPGGTQARGPQGDSAELRNVSRAPHSSDHLDGFRRFMADKFDGLRLPRGKPYGNMSIGKGCEIGFSVRKKEVVVHFRSSGHLAPEGVFGWIEEKGLSGDEIVDGHRIEPFASKRNSSVVRVELTIQIGGQADLDSPNVREEAVALFEAAKSAFSGLPGDLNG